MSVPLSELGKSLKCPNCVKVFGDITGLKVSDKDVELFFNCKTYVGLLLQEIFN